MAAAPARQPRAEAQPPPALRCPRWPPTAGGHEDFRHLAPLKAIATLEEAVRHCAQAPAAVRGHSELKPAALTVGEQKDLAAFLPSLNELKPPALEK